MKKAAKFGVVGITNTVIDLILFNIIFYLTHNIYVATSLAFIFAATNSYILNRSWTFRDHKTDKVWLQYLQFIGVMAVGLAINNFIVFLLLHFLNITSEIIKANIIRISAIAVVVFWNYGVSRFYIFRHPVEGKEA